MGALRVALVVMVVLASAAGAAALAWRTAVPADVQARADVEALVVARQVARALAPAVATQDPARRSAALHELADAFQVDLALLDATGQTVAVAGAPIPPLAPEELSAVQAGQVRRVGPAWPPRVAVPLDEGGRPGLAVQVQLANTAAPSRTVTLALLVALALVAAALAGGLARGSGGAMRRLEAALDVLETLPRGEALDVGADRDLAGVAERINRLVERVAAAAERDEELLAIVARELRRPVRDARETLKRMAAGEPFARGPSELDEELDVLETILEDVLTTARLKLDRMVLRKRRTRLGVLVQDAGAKVASTNPVTFDIDPDLPEVDVDGRLLARAVSELVVNAAQHSDPGAAIAVRARVRGPSVVVSVTDGGGGIAPADQERLFEPFFRSKATRRHLPGRTGLGLTLAKRIVEAHGGVVTVDSAAGVGTTVSFTLSPATGEPPEERPSLDGAPRDSFSRETGA